MSGRGGSEACLARWRAEGADAADPVSFLFMEALARRAAPVEGEARRLLDARLDELIEAYAARLAGRLEGARPMVGQPARPGARPGAGPGLGGRRARGPLGRLADDLGATAAPADGLRGLAEFREIWSRASADQRLRQTLAQVPPQAGPINSEHLVHRALSSMREVSPECLRHFVSHVDALMALERLLDAGGPAGAAPAARGRGGRRTRRAPG